MNTIKDLIINNDWILLITMLFGLFGLPIGIYSSIKAKINKEVTYDLFTTRLITNANNSYENLLIKYNGKQIPNFSSTKFLFWNSGNRIINGQDISDIDHLRLNVYNGIILDYKVIQPMSKTNQIIIVKNEHSLLIKFDYIGINDGMILEVLHSASESEDLIMKGTIKGFGSPIRNKNKSNKLLKLMDKVFTITFGRIINSVVFKTTFFLVILLFSIFITFISFFLYTDNISTGIITTCVGTLYFLLALAGLRRRVPRKFNKFMENAKL